MRRQSFEGEDIILIVGGEGHKVGQEPDTNARYFSLAEWMTKETFKVKEILIAGRPKITKLPTVSPTSG
jgi:hypothetical protein